MAEEADIEQKLQVKEKQSTHESQRGLRRKIIESIIQEGILSGKDLMDKGIVPQSSSDSLDSNWPFQVYGALVLRKDQEGVDWSHPEGYSYPRVKVDVGDSGQTTVAYDKKKGKIEEQYINWALYEGISSVFPVIAERNDERTNETAQLPTEVLENRLANSLLIITPFNTIKVNTLDKYEVWAKSPVASNNFLAVLTPEPLAAEVIQLFQGTKIPVISVSSRKAKLFDGERELTVPDYESEVRKRLKASPRPLFLHGVRLPTESDIKANQA
jgi:hypothetical protein